MGMTQARFCIWKVSVPKTQKMEPERLWQHQAGLPVSFLQWIGFPRASKNVAEGEVQDSINISALSNNPFVPQPPELAQIKASALPLQKSSGFFPCGAPQCSRARIPYPQALDCLWHSTETWPGLYLVHSCQGGTGKMLPAAVQMGLEGMWLMLLLSSCCKTGVGVRTLPVTITAAAAAPAARLVFGRKGQHIFKVILKANLKTSLSFNLLSVIQMEWY